MLENKLKKKLEEIFRAMDKNGNGKLNADEISLDDLSSEVLVVLKPILLELEEYQEELDCEEFVESVMAMLANASSI
jgi:Ca2+-binding EF-hand superfamily protein